MEEEVPGKGNHAIIKPVKNLGITNISNQVGYALRSATQVNCLVRFTTNLTFWCHTSVKSCESPLFDRSLRRFLLNAVQFYKDLSNLLLLDLSIKGEKVFG